MLETVDWVSLTLGDDFPHEIWSGLLGLPPDQWESLPNGNYGYERCKQQGHVRVYYDGAPGMGSHCRISGQGCRELEACGAVKDWGLWAAELLDIGVKVTRLDVARDDRGGILDLGELIDLARARQFTSRAHNWRPVEEYGRAGELVSRGLIFGRRTSETYMRIYDKALEQHEDDHWVRVELELHGGRAMAAFRELAARGLSWLAGAIRAHVDFKAEPIGDQNRTRVASLAAWDAFLAGAARVQLAVEAVRRTVETVMHHLERQWAPLMATVVTARAGDVGWLHDICRAGVHRMRDRHAVLLRSEAT